MIACDHPSCEDRGVAKILTPLGSVVTCRPHGVDVLLNTTTARRWIGEVRGDRHPDFPAKPVPAGWGAAR